MDWYSEETLVLEHIAEAKREAARRHLVSRAKPAPVRRRWPVVVEPLRRVGFIARLLRHTARLALR